MVSAVSMLIDYLVSELETVVEGSITTARELYTLILVSRNNFELIRVQSNVSSLMKICTTNMFKYAITVLKIVYTYFLYLENIVKECFVARSFLCIFFN